MSDPTCSVPGCDTRRRSRRALYCEMHYYRLRRGGTLDARPHHKRTVCTAPDCDKPEAMGYLCAMHYARMQRTGTLAGLRPRRGGLCSIEGCGLPHESNGWCERHARRARLNGDPLVVRQGKPPSGPLHPRWRGDAVSYSGWHARLINVRGRASEHECVDCGSPANDWSYNHTSSDEHTAVEGPYVLDVDHYSPRCRRCHAAFDAHDRATAYAQPGGWHQ